PGSRSAPLVVDRALLRRWMQRVRGAMGDAQPTLALRRTGLTGRVKVAFEIASDGRVLSVRLRESGGHELLDQAALEFARSVRRVEAPPAELHWSELPSQRRRITLPIRYGS
ncbi:MAG: energy transducer TonB, partial [Myxococcota bacterium]